MSEAGMPHMRAASFRHDATLSKRLSPDVNIRTHRENPQPFCKIKKPGR
ncbi:MAG: hypothetical protein JWN15_280 [Firmicutes bacterium]|nr:hypothetical protein [Bacillota bacterium]